LGVLKETLYNESLLLTLSQSDLHLQVRSSESLTTAIIRSSEDIDNSTRDGESTAVFQRHNVSLVNQV